MKRIWTRGSLALLLTLLTGGVIVWRIVAQPSAPATPGIAWQEQDVGATGVIGAAEPTETGWRVQGAGADIWGGADAFHFVYVPWDGNVELIARVLRVEKTDPWAKAGLMIRASLDQTSPHAFAAWTPEKGAAFIRRLAPGARSRDDSHQAMRMVAQDGKVLFQQRGSAGTDQATGSITSEPTPRWLRLVRQGNVLRAFDSADGLNWEWLGTDSIDLPSRLFVGLAVTSHDAARLCTADFASISLAAPKLALPAPATVGAGDGLQATYFPGMDLSGQGVQRVDSVVNFDWGWESPCAGIGRNQFSVRWEGELEAQYTEPYAIQMVSDDRARVWLNGELLIDEWYEHAEQASSAVVNLEAGKRYLVRIDYFENRGRALVKLFWSSPSTPLQVIPQTQLYSRITNQNGDGIPDVWKRANGLDPADPSAADRIIQETGLSARQLYASGFEPAAPAKPIGSWFSQDIGRAGVEGSASRLGNTWMIQGSGADIWANADAFHFVYQPWRGDGQIVARLLSQDNTDPWAKAGVMVRASLRPDAPHLMLAATAEHGLVLVTRDAPGQSSASRVINSPAAQTWLKLVRRGQIVSAFTSADGSNWNWIDTQRLAAANETGEIYAGLAVCSHDNSILGAASFDQVDLGQPEPERSLNVSQGTGDGLTATYFDSRSGRIVSRIDPAVNFDWDIDSPAEGIGADFFSVCWEGLLEPQSAELYALHLLSDDGARLWLDGQLLIDGWTDHGPEEQTVQLQVQAGRRHALRIEYFDRTGEAICKLLWSSPSIPKQPVPQSQLYSLTASATQTLGDSQGTSSTNPEPEAENGSPKIKTEKGPLTPIITGVRLVEGVAGSDAVARLGSWEAEDTSIYATGRRGWLDYDLSAPADDIYRVEIEGASHNPFDPDPGFYLVVSIDGEDLGRVLLDAGFGRPGLVQVQTPWIKAGKHRLRLFWDNVRKGRSLQVNAVYLQTMEGPDANGNGVKDWVEEQLARENGIDGLAPLPTDRGLASSGILSSTVSPACLEGRGRFLRLMKIRLGDGQEIQPQHGLGDRWWANVPLRPGDPTDVEVSFQNESRVEKCRIVWKPTTPLLYPDVVIRQGDSLLFNVAAAGRQRSPSHLDSVVDETLILSIDDLSQESVASSGWVARRFDRFGTFTVSGTYAGSSSSQSDGVKVRVLEGSFDSSPVAWVGRSRTWGCPNVPSEATVNRDPRVKWEEGEDAQITRSFRLLADQPEDRYVLARLRGAGPVLAATPIRGIHIYGVSESALPKGV